MVYCPPMKNNQSGIQEQQGIKSSNGKFSCLNCGSDFIFVSLKGYSPISSMFNQLVIFS